MMAIKADDKELDILLRNVENDVIARLEIRKESAYIAGHLLGQEDLDQFEAMAERVLAWITKKVE